MATGRMMRVVGGAMLAAAAMGAGSTALAADYDPAAPVYVHQPPMESRKDVKVTLPPVAKAGEHPCLLMTKSEELALRETLQTTERGKAAYKSLMNVASGALAGPLDFPDPKGPMGQMKDRGDAVAGAHDKLSLAAGRLGMAYAMSGEKKYADRAAEILRGYAQRYAQYPEHKGVNRDDTGKVMAQRLSEAMWLLPMIEAYDEIYDSGALSEADKTNIEQNLLIAGVTFIRHRTAAAEAAARDKQNPDWRTTTPPRRYGPVGNWLNFYAAATMLTGAVTGNRDMVDLAAADYRQYIQNGITDDGMWGEGAIGYQLFALNAMTTGVEAAARQGIDLWSFENCRMKMLFDSPLWYAYPDSTMPGINDSGRVALGDWTTEIYDYGYARYHDARYAALVNRSPRQLFESEGIYVPTVIYKKLDEPAAVSYPSMLFANLGYAIMRDNGRYVLLKGGHTTGVHEHLDKLNVIVFDKDELGGEPKFHRYEDPLHDQWTKQTLAHNTMAVDERSQALGDVKMLVFEDAGALKVMRGESANLYPGVVMDRTVVLTPTLVIDVYHGQSQIEHTWDSTLRYNGTLEGRPIDQMAKPLGAQDGYQHFMVYSRKPADSGWRGVWETKVGKLVVDAAGEPGEEAIEGTGPDKDNLTVLREKGKTAIFAKALKLADAGAAVSSAKFIRTGRDDLTGFEVVQGDRGTAVFVSYGNRPWEVAAVKSDAKVLVITDQGKQGPAQVLLTGGTFATISGVEMKFDKAGNYAGTLLPDGKVDVTAQWVPAASVETAAPPKRAARNNRAK